MSKTISEIYGEDFARAMALVEAQHDAAKRAEEQKQKDKQYEQGKIDAEKEKYRELLKVPFMGITQYAYFIHSKGQTIDGKDPFAFAFDFITEFAREIFVTKREEKIAFLASLDGAK
jgi:hypothetical protein